jgi:FtsH-binding integral membrane protein
MYPLAKRALAHARAAVRVAPWPRMDAHTEFLARTYLHLVGAMSVFFVLIAVFVGIGLGVELMRVGIFQSWLLVMGACLLVSHLATRLVSRGRSQRAQYLGLGLYVVFHAVLFTPMVTIAVHRDPAILLHAGFTAVVGCCALTAVAWNAGRDFPVLETVTRWALVCGLLLIVSGILFGFDLGVWFSVLMVGVGGGAILSNTARILHATPHDCHVAAALQLFSSISLTLWYLLRLFLGMSR